MARIIERLQAIEELQTTLETHVGLHDLILNGKPAQEIPGLIKQHKETRKIVEDHEEYIKKRKWTDNLLKIMGGVVGGAIITLVLKFLETKI